jgi:hypothetical protein
MLKYLVLVGVAALCVVCCTNAQVLRSGSCPKIGAMPNFDTKKVNFSVQNVEILYGINFLSLWVSGSSKCTQGAGPAIWGAAWSIFQTPGSTRSTSTASPTVHRKHRIFDVVSVVKRYFFGLKRVERTYQIKGIAEFKASDGNALFDVTIPDLSKFNLLLIFTCTALCTKIYNYENVRFLMSWKLAWENILSYKDKLYLKLK